MAFFDDLGKKISKAGQSAVQKTKELADIAKLNSSISDEERRIDDSYREIGKLYDSLRGSDPEVDFAPLIASVRESEEKIKEFRQQIKDIKGVVCCEKCGAEVSSNAAFCSACGAPMPVVVPVEVEASQVQNVEDGAAQAQTAETGAAEEQTAETGTQAQTGAQSSAEAQTGNSVDQN